MFVTLIMLLVLPFICVTQGVYVRSLIAHKYEIKTQSKKYRFSIFNS